jgi:hypothetical protein
LQECGVASTTSVQSKRSERFATQAREPWGPVEDAVLMSGEHRQSALVTLLGRSIRAIQARKHRLRALNEEATDKQQGAYHGQEKMG